MKPRMRSVTCIEEVSPDRSIMLSTEQHNDAALPPRGRSGLQLPGGNSLAAQFAAFLLGGSKRVSLSPQPPVLAARYDWRRHVLALAARPTTNGGVEKDGLKDAARLLQDESRHGDRGRSLYPSGRRAEKPPRIDDDSRASK